MSRRKQHMNGWLCFFGDFRTVEYWSPLETHKVVRERIWKILVNLVQIVEVCFPDLCTFSLPLPDRWAMQPLASLGRKFKIQRFPHPLRWNRTNQNFASVCHPPIHLRNMRVYPQGRDPANLIFFNLLHLVINSNYWAITQKKPHFIVYFPQIGFYFRSTHLSKWDCKSLFQAHICRVNRREEKQHLFEVFLNT